MYATAVPALSGVVDALRWAVVHWPVTLTLVFVVAVLYLFTALIFDLPLPGAARPDAEPPAHGPARRPGRAKRG